MIWKSIVIPHGIVPTSARWPAISGFACRTVEPVTDFASVVHNLVLDVRDSYRPELHYMRGPGPKCRAKHQPIQLRLAQAEPNLDRRSAVRKSYQLTRADLLAKSTD